MSFSPEAYADLMANPRVTDETKAKIQQKMIAYGVEEAEVYGDEAKSESLVECINNGIQEFFDDSKNWDAVLSDEEVGVLLFLGIVAAAVAIFILPILGTTAPGGPKLSSEPPS